MKTRFKIIGILIFVFLIFFLYVITIQKEFNSKLELVKYRGGNIVYYEYPMDYFFQEFECPISIQDIINSGIEDPVYINHINTQLKDVFSKKENALLSYIPVYNPKNLKREGFVMLSAGIDGKLNNIFDVKTDTVFIDNLNDRFKLYNPRSFSEPTSSSILQNINGFNLYNYFFGKKDCVLEYFNCIDFYKMQPGAYSLDELIERKSNKKDKGRIVVVELEDYMLLNTENDSIKTFRYKDLLVKCKAYDYISYELEPNSSGKIVGIYDGLSINGQEVFLYNCIQVN